MRRLTHTSGLYRREAVAKGRCLIGHATWRRIIAPGGCRRGLPGHTRGNIMGGKVDQMKGRLKEAVGVLMDDDSLKDEGKLDQLGGEIKETAERVAEKVKETVAKAVEKVKEK